MNGLGENVFDGEDGLDESISRHLQDWLDWFVDHDACSWLMKKCLYLVVNLKKVHLGKEGLPHKNMHDGERTQSEEGDGCLGVCGLKLEGRVRNGKI